MKKVIMSVLIGIVSLVCFLSGAKAYVITANDVEKHYKENKIRYSDISNVVINGTMIEAYNEEDELLEKYDMSKGYIDYTYKKGGNIDNSLLKLIQNTITDSWPNFLSPYFKNKDENFNYRLLNEGEKAEFYEKYGLYSREVTDDTGEYVYVKTSFDLDKFDNYFLEFVKIDDQLDEDTKRVLMYTPSLSFEDIKQTSASIYPQNIENVILDEGDNLCEVYRSTKKDGKYEKITVKPMICNGEYALKDDSLEPDTTYYYKVRMYYTNVLSDPFELTTKSDKSTRTKKVEVTDESTTTTTKKTVPDNPKTGVTAHVIGYMLIAVAGILLIVLLKKKNKLFNQI